MKNDLKQLMTAVTRPMEKAQEAVAGIASKVMATTAETGPPRLRRARARRFQANFYARWQSGAYWAMAAFAALGGLVLLGVLCGGGKERCVGADERVSLQG